jgi:hypothetical protein
MTLKQINRVVTGQEMFGFASKFHEMNGLLWSNCVAICSDGAAALTGTKRGFTARVKVIVSHVIFQHCMMHREALVAKKLQPDVNKVLQDAVSIVNFTKVRVGFLKFCVTKWVLIMINSYYTLR